jgi:DNA end-binding protein Ku
MTKTGRVAVGRYSTRGRLQLVLLRPKGEGLAMHGLYYADEVRSFGDIEIDRTIALKDAELGLATQLIDQLSNETFDPKKYEDDYRADLLSAIDRKVAGEEIVVAKPEEQREQIIDLVAALKKSLGDKAMAAPKAEAEDKERKAPKAKGKKAASR